MKKTTSYQSLNDTIENAILEARRLFINGPIDMELANSAIRKIWFLHSLAPNEPVTVIINSPGGSVHAGFAIWDQLHMAGFPLTTLVTGLAGSMGSVLALCAPKERRFATPQARFLIHQPSLSGNVEGQVSDLEIQAKEILNTKDLIITLYSEATGKTQSEVAKAIDRDCWMSAQEAISFGLIGSIAKGFQDIV